MADEGWVSHFRNSLCISANESLIYNLTQRHRASEAQRITLNILCVFVPLCLCAKTISMLSSFTFPCATWAAGLPITLDRITGLQDLQDLQDFLI